MYADKLWVKVAVCEDTVPQRYDAKPAFDQIRSTILYLVHLKKKINKAGSFLSEHRADVELGVLNVGMYAWWITAACCEHLNRLSRRV